MAKQERLFSISGNNKGLWCPFKAVLCQEGYCAKCQIYLDWQKLGEIIVICAQCGKVKSRKPNRGRPVVSRRICLECKAKRFLEIMSRHK